MAAGLFCCSMCGFKISFDCKSKCPAYFNKDVEILEEIYSIRDPFADDNLGGLILGSDCCVCGHMVCASPSCSIFFEKRYCRDCAQKHMEEFPVDVREELRRRAQ
ncbi:unnamed protein product [Calicophoron daubneyi]|uniref:Cysteine-rich DPF motif domain-containing protein 1 n=1 Tax=Calicophoron daubneyi TaxID=300641 RepID=A0AAV2TJ85_CALDB